ncbi:MAG: Na+/H+ antiporter NhaC family protein, partial [Oscillospiraceae bacterium]
SADFQNADDIIANPSTEKLVAREWLILALFVGAFMFFAIGAPIFGLNTLSLGSIMLPVGIVCGFLAKYDLDTIMKHFVKGAQSMVGVLVFMILACGMTVILNNTKVLDTIVYYFSIPLSYLGNSFAAVGMFIVNAFINIFINSGSGQTAVMMPIMAPLADVIGVSRQMAVLALQFGDGFTNLLAPTSVTLLACLSLAKVSMTKWYKFVVPVYSIVFVVLCASIFVGTAIGY